MELLKEMLTDGVRPDAVTYGTIVAAVSVRCGPSGLRAPPRAFDATHGLQQQQQYVSTAAAYIYSSSLSLQQQHYVSTVSRVDTVG